MDKDKLINVTKRFYKNELSIPEAHIFLKEYCIERGKEDIEKIDIFLQMMTFSNQLGALMEFAINYYRREYDLVMLYKPIANSSDRDIILIY